MSYDVWVRDIKKEIDLEKSQWNRVGIWGFPSKDNSCFTDMVIHYCEDYHVWWSNDNPFPTRSLDKCHVCGEETPDGIKMIALLEKL